MLTKTSYTDSHKYTCKGTEYEQHYQTQPWDKFLWSREREILLKILGRYFADREIHLLDFACGTGRIISLLENYAVTSLGIDVSESMLKIAREKLTRTELIEADITEDNIFETGRFNLITAFRFFLNAEPELRTKAIRKLSELLTDDGIFVFNNHHNSGSPWVKLLNAYSRCRNTNGTYNTMSIGQMRLLAEEAGLEIIEIYATGFFHPPKVPVSFGLNRIIDRIAGRFDFLAGFSENIIAVCRKSAN
jgi:predicted TPR repeat methyltransferase